MTIKKYPWAWIKSYNAVSKTELFYYVIMSLQKEGHDVISDAEIVARVKQEASLWDFAQNVAKNQEARK